MSGSGTPPPPPPARQFIITQEQLEQLFEQAVANLNEAAQRANRGTTNHLKLVEQKPFNGKPNKQEDFIAECELSSPISIGTTTRRSYVYALQLMMQGITAPWKSSKDMLNEIRGIFSKIVYTNLFKMWAKLTTLSSG